jgi:hypothetical protein
VISLGRLILLLALEALAAVLLVWALLQGDHAATRWIVLLSALALALIARAFGVAIWLDVTVLALAIAAIAVADRAHEPKASPPTATPPPPVTFALPSPKLVAEKPIAAHKPGVLILLDPRTGSNKPASYEPHRYEVVFCDALPSPPPEKGNVRVKVKRGPNDATASQFAAQLLAAKQIVVLPPRK